ncbi:ClpB protein [Cronobacter sakazakii 696]|nr:ClpB protein [Cronobacter sakazakii 696]
MSEISRAVLFGKLDTLLFTSLESATSFCKLRGNPYVELAHWLHQLMFVGWLVNAGRRGVREGIRNIPAISERKNNAQRRDTDAARRLD